MKCLVLGAHGQLGRDMHTLCTSRYTHTYAYGRSEVDIADSRNVHACISGVSPDMVINCAAFTDVDGCEHATDRAYLINRDAVANCAAACARLDIPLVHISTDYVFDGTKTSPYTEEDAVNPLSVYGASKRAGEEILMQTCRDYAVFRVSWLYGRQGKKNFVKAIQRQIDEKGKKRLSVVNDQTGTPTYTMDVCRQVIEAMDNGARGIFHCSAEGECSWYDFACHIVSTYAPDVEIVACTTEELGLAAPRPRYSVLENARLKAAGVHRMPHWREGYRRYMQQDPA